MTAFEFISVALSFVIGLGFARLLTAAVAAFRARNRCRLDWLPFAWATLMFLWLIQYWWAIFELNLIIDDWAMWRFIFLLVLALLLFAASALVLPVRPGSEGLYEDFRRNGRWALVVLAVYFFVAVSANWLLFGMSPAAPLNLLTIVLMVPPLVVFTSASRRVQGIATLLNVPLSLFAFVQFSPGLY